jgi:tetratricopeptide (TPR) repeat protein
VKPNVLRALVVAVGAALWLAGVAEARNPNCAGGIQYLTQALQDNAKGNTEDYHREINKAVQRLEMCSSEDPNDVEALGYLGWAYAEVDSAAAAGRTFADAIQKLTAKGDKKKADVVATNRDHYWSLAFNDGIANINAAQTAYPDFTKPTAGDADVKAKADATAKYQKAAASLTRAALIKPGDPHTLRNLGSIYAFMGDYGNAQKWFQEGLRAAPNDTDLANSMRSVTLNRANELMDKKEYDQAIAMFADMLKTNPKDPLLHAAVADAHFRKAQGLEGEARKPEFKAAGDEYAKAAELKPGLADYPFNAGLAYQSAGEFELAEAQWRGAVKAKPGDVDAMSSLGSTLAEEKKYDEAIGVLHEALTADPKNQSIHRQLGAVYTKAGNNAKGTEELMIYLALHNGQPVADAAAAAKQATAGSAAAKTLASLGQPEQINLWDADSEKYESWFYWSKKQAYHFKAGTLVQKSDWSTAATPK